MRVITDNPVKNKPIAIYLYKRITFSICDVLKSIRLRLDDKHQPVLTFILPLSLLKGCRKF